MTESSQVPETDAAEVADDAVILDVREPDEWAAGHIPHALHIPLGQLPARVAEVPEGSLVVVCRSGKRSAQATGFLRQHGREATNLAGGMQAWHALGRPMRSDSVTQPSVM